MLPVAVASDTTYRIGVRARARARNSAREMSKEFRQTNPALTFNFKYLRPREEKILSLQINSVPLGSSNLECRETRHILRLEFKHVYIRIKDTLFAVRQLNSHPFKVNFAPFPKASSRLTFTRRRGYLLLKRRSGSMSSPLVKGS